MGCHPRVAVRRHASPFHQTSSERRRPDMSRHCCVNILNVWRHAQWCSDSMPQWSENHDHLRITRFCQKLSSALGIVRQSDPGRMAGQAGRHKAARRRRSQTRATQPQSASSDRWRERTPVAHAYRQRVETVLKVDEASYLRRASQYIRWRAAAVPDQLFPVNRPQMSHASAS